MSRKETFSEHSSLQNKTRPELASCHSPRQASEPAVLLDIRKRRSVTISPPRAHKIETLANWETKLLISCDHRAPQLQRPAQPNALCCDVSKVLGTPVPSGADLLQAPHHPLEQFSVRPCHLPSNVVTSVASMANCAPRKKRKTVSHHFQPSAVCHPKLEQVKIFDDDVTRPPASRQALATKLSNAHPRPANTPARAQAARWWPQE